MVVELLGILPRCMYHGLATQKGCPDEPETQYNDNRLGLLSPFLCSNLKGFIGRWPGHFRRAGGESGLMADDTRQQTLTTASYRGG